MNADTRDARSPHVDLADLIAEVTGQPVGDPARQHLTDCEHCRAEANRWNLVAGGIRALAAAAPEAVTREAAQPGRPLQAGARALTASRRRTLLAAGAAAALVLLAGGYGVTAALTRHTPAPLLTAVSGCSGLEQARGTLEQVHGTSLVIETASGQPVTVTTTPSTRLSLSGVSLQGEITDGTPVTVAGFGSGGTIAANLVAIDVPFRLRLAPGLVTVEGTVADASTAGFTVVTSTGTRVPVTTSGDTVVTVFNPTLDRLPVGATTLAVGHAGPDGTLQATIAAVFLESSSGPQVNGHYDGPGGCSPTSLLELAMGLALGG